MEPVRGPDSSLVILQKKANKIEIKSISYSDD